MGSFFLWVDEFLGNVYMYGVEFRIVYFWAYDLLQIKQWDSVVCVVLLEHGADDSVLMKIIEMKNKVVVIAGFAVLAFIVWLAIAIKNNQRPERIMVDIVDTMAPESLELRKELEKKEESYRGLQKLYVDDIDIYQEENDFLKKENVRLRKDVALRERLLFNEIQNLQVSNQLDS